jgi:hypothetical protein
MLTPDDLSEGAPAAISAAPDARSGSFVDNMKLPIHRWFRYSAGFSAQWAEEVIRASGATSVLDPFAGSGTTLLAADALQVRSVGLEAHPFVARIGAAKLCWQADIAALEAAAESLLRKARRRTTGAAQAQAAPELMAKCYEPEALAELYCLRGTWLAMADELPPVLRELLFLALTAILRECSYVGTAQWQYVLPNKRKKKVVTPFEAFRARIAMFMADMESFQGQAVASHAALLRGDAREIHAQVAEKFDLLLTSPPYPNNYDYADATRLEMTFWGDVASWGDLHDAVRKYLVRSSSQHTAKDKLKLDELLAAPILTPIRAELTTVCNELAEIRETKGGKKTYHTMVAAYFKDMAEVLQSARGVMRPGGTMCFVIGDSAPYGVYVPADAWFSRLADSAGFKGARFEKIRDRNTKWKNRKHTVPLNEGRLWIAC